MNKNYKLQILNESKKMWGGPHFEKSLIEWTFTQYTDRLFPFYFFECKMHGWGLTSRGFSVSKNRLEAIKKAFAEAWERLWFLHLNVLDTQIIKFSSTNGFAAGLDNKMALENSERELAERAVLLTSWFSKIGWRKAGFANLISNFLSKAINLKGWQVDLFDLNSNIGNVKCGLLRHKTKGAVFDSCFNSNNKMAEEQVLLSLLKTLFFQTETNPEYVFPEIGNPDDHRKFYSNIKNISAFDFCDLLINANTSIYVEHKEQTISKIVIDASVDFPAVAYSVNPFWPQLKWGKVSIAGSNPWPHPLC